VLLYFFYFAFLKRKVQDTTDLDAPINNFLKPYRETVESGMKYIYEHPHTEVYTKSFDGLRLCAQYYPCGESKRTIIIFHGYRSSPQRDFSCAVKMYGEMGLNVLMVDQRSSGKSEGHVITFGIREHRDCLSWTEFVIRRFGPDVKIILTGISMGASTVMMAGGTDLPKQVIGILADCGFTSPKAIIQKVIGQMGLPPKLCYPFVKWGAALYGHFNLEEGSALDAVKRCRVPVLFFHGDADDYVPIEMSYENYNACASRKQLVVVKNAGHGLSYLLDNPAYLTAAKEFFEQ
jgi:fermentation-respiration switch protein FrsA (DUF1100 family)